MPYRILEDNEQTQTPIQQSTSPIQQSIENVLQEQYGLPSQLEPLLPNYKPGLLSKTGARAYEGVGGFVGNIPAGAIGLANLLLPQKNQIPSYETIRESVPALPPSSAGLREKGYLGIIPSTKQISQTLFGSPQALEPSTPTEEAIGDIAEIASSILTPKGVFKAVTTGQKLGKALGVATAGVGTRKLLEANILKPYIGEKGPRLGEALVYIGEGLRPGSMKKAAAGKYENFRSNLEPLERPVFKLTAPQKKTLRNLENEAGYGYSSDPNRVWMQEKIQDLVNRSEVNIKDIFAKNQDINANYYEIPYAARPYAEKLKEFHKNIIKEWGKENNFQPAQDFLEGAEMYKALHKATTLSDLISKMGKNKIISPITAAAITGGFGLMQGYGKLETLLGAGAYGALKANQFYQAFKTSPAIRKYIGQTIKEGMKSNLAAASNSAKKADKLIMRNAENKGKYRVLD